ncbi:MAG TPA: hypothetical protein VF783_00625, partial [Terriglobales bacterium]
VCDEIESCAAPSQYVRSGPGTWIVMVGVGPTSETKAIIGRWDDATGPPRQPHPPLVANPEEST